MCEDESMRWSTGQTWVCIGWLCAAYLVVPGVLCLNRLWQSDQPTLLALSWISVLLIVLPAITVVLAAWDGMRHGFTVLWIVAPLLCFLAPMYIFFNDSALIYGVIYSALATLANGAGAAIRRLREQN